VDKEDVACYRLYSANCVELAERTADADRRVFLLRMGQRWARLADRVEKAERADSDAASRHRTAASRDAEIQASQANVSKANVSQANADDSPSDQIRIGQTGDDQTGDQNDGGAGVSSG
jgi:hypothetical protein